MSKKITIIIILALALLSAWALWDKPKEEPVPIPTISDEEQVRNVVTEFGAHLKNVPLASGPNILRTTIEKEYSDHLTPLLLLRFLDDPAHAPGRPTSSPWPENIEIKSVQKIGDYYEVEGQVVWMTSTGEADRTPVFITVANIDGTWLVAEYQTSME